MSERGRHAHPADPWLSIPAVPRVMAGWFLVGIGVLNLAVEVDGGLTGAYPVFHGGLLIGGLLLLTRRRPRPTTAGLVAGGLVTAAGMVLGALRDSASCCMAEHPQRYGYPFPFLGAGDGLHIDPKYLAADLIFWGCAGLVASTLVTVVERARREERTPVDLTYVARHAEPAAMAETPDRADENVGGLT